MQFVVRHRFFHSQQNKLYCACWCFLFNFSSLYTTCLIWHIDFHSVTFLYFFGFNLCLFSKNNVSIGGKNYSINQSNLIIIGEFFCNISIMVLIKCWWFVCVFIVVIAHTHTQYFDFDNLAQIYLMVCLCMLCIIVEHCSEPNWIFHKKRWNKYQSTLV